MATNAELITSILFHVGRRMAYRAEALAMAKSWVNMRELGNFLPWFLETESSGLVTVAEQDWIALPADFLREYDEGIMLITDADGAEQKLVKTPSLDRLFSEEDDDSGFPKGYYLFRNRIYLRPIPDSIFSVRFFYHGKSTVLDDSNTEATYWGKYADSALIFGAATIFAGTVLQNEKLARTLSSLEERAIGELMVMDEARKHAAQAYGIED